MECYCCWTKKRFKEFSDETSISNNPKPKWIEDTHEKALTHFINQVPRNIYKHIFVIYTYPELQITPIQLWINRYAGETVLHYAAKQKEKFQGVKLELKDEYLECKSGGRDIKLKFKQYNKKGEFIIGMIVNNTEEVDYILSKSRYE